MTGTEYMGNNALDGAGLQKQLLMDIHEIFASEDDREDKDRKGEEGNDEQDGDEDEVVDLVDMANKTEKLRDVLEAVRQLWSTKSEHVDLVTEKLADGSRDPRWRVPLGDSGILDFFANLLSTQRALNNTLKIHILRLIGNSCADTDENRARVVAANCIPSIMMQLSDASLLPFVIPVLFNICVDYEPAQQQASNSRLSKALIELVSSPQFNDSRTFLGYVCRILDLLIQQSSEQEIASIDTPVILLNIAADRHSLTDLDDFVALVNTSVAYLAHEKFQRFFIEQGALEATLAIMVDSYTRFDTLPPASSSSPDNDDANTLSQMRSGLNQVLSDISALPQFKTAYPILSPVASSLRRWISSPQLQLQVCGCIMLGNLARSDEACEVFVHTSKIHKPLIAAIADASDSQLLHAALGFLKNLALPPKNKREIGISGIFEALPRLWALDTLQQVQHSSISLTRQLVVGTWENARTVCHRLSDDQDSPANMRSDLSLLIALFERTDVEPIRMEIARLMTAVCRILSIHKGHTPEKMEQIRQKFFLMHPDIGRPLSLMISQTKWPVVRSEGWFVFALMAKHPEGAQCINDIMQDVAVFQPLVELLTGKSIANYESPSSSKPSSPMPTLLEPMSLEVPQQPVAQAAEMARVDRENALVLVSELLRNSGDYMAVMRRSLFQDLLNGGAEALATYRDVGAISAPAGPTAEE